MEVEALGWFDVATVGRLNFTDNLIDPALAPSARAPSSPSPDGVLLPGQFVRVYLKGGKLKNAMLIPQRAVSTQQGKLVFVANAQNKAEPRPVELGDEVKNEVIVGARPASRRPGDCRWQYQGRPGAPVKVVDPTAAGKPAAAPAKGAWDSLFLGLLFRQPILPASSPSSSCWPALPPCGRCRWSNTRRSCRRRCR